ncbi:MAG: ribosomal-protein-serine acetyltransferase [Methanococcus sp.]|nr:ribosomal-protein-serine acetyltransferase [Methanococcus sp.]
MYVLRVYEVIRRREENMVELKVDSQIVLKEIELSDAEDIFKLIDSDRENLRIWLSFVDSTKEIEDTKDFIRSILFLPGDIRDFVAVIIYNEQKIGLIGFKLTDFVNKKTEIGYWISKEFENKGIVTKSVVKMINYAFNNLELNRIQIKCGIGNEKSSKIPKKLNFKFEGIERSAELLNGKFIDAEVYSILKDEWTFKN